ncbi:MULTISPECIES: lipoate--protein ligase family protein [Allobacillus]|uniref:Octanoyl-[GcvH]:protein N-octanoyltransferase n=1 Tax=Allobacillus salarius TaxID=1955272 RepID=A0A556P6P8_9BACI|nr:lipoate--protein ligase family protein [Allobacillus salarius]TSJ60052.1 lipoate--protein ligase family protein [Allobacillus salarius]
MKHKLLQFDQLQMMDDTNPNESNVLASFAMDDTLCIAASENNEAGIRFWVHGPTAVLGIPDSRLPNINEAVDYLTAQQHDVIIRNSGGLAVILDEGILNISLIFPHGKNIDIHEGYETMVEFVQWIFDDEPIKIEAYEIEDSYCPGTYDLSVNGKKFAGVSQRRVKEGTAVQVYLAVEGSGSERAELVRQFYQIGKNNEDTKFTYPEVNPEVMVTLEEVLNKPMSVEGLVSKINRKLTDDGVQLTKKVLNEQETEWFEKRLSMMKKRNEQINS